MISSIRLLTLLRGKWLYTHCTVKKGHQVCCSPWRHKESDTTEQLNNTVKTLSEERWMTLRKLRTRIRWQNALTPSLPKKKKKKEQTEYSKVMKSIISLCLVKNEVLDSIIFQQNWDGPHLNNWLPKLPNLSPHRPVEGGPCISKCL